MEQTYRSPQASRGAEAGRGQQTDSLHVVCFSTFVSEPTQRRAEHADVRNFLLALRGEKFDGEATVPVGSEERQLNRRNANDSIDWFGEMVSDYFDTHRVPTDVALVPVPTSRATLESSSGPWTSLLAISIASNGVDQASVVDVLRWKRPLEPPQQRSQSVAELYENLAILQPLAPGTAVVLVDYLFTSSATLKACAARLQEVGADVVLGICAGRTATKSDLDPFTVVTGALHGFAPGN